MKHNKKVNKNPDSCEFCPFGEEKEDMPNLIKCKICGIYFDKEHSCEVAPFHMKDYIKRTRGVK